MIQVKGDFQVGATYFLNKPCRVFNQANTVANMINFGIEVFQTEGNAPCLSKLGNALERFIRCNPAGNLVGFNAVDDFAIGS